jgi:4-cresol dehydrogenase (hydroxylating)
MLTPRSVYAVISITYDRDVPGEDERAMSCYRQLSQLCAEAGYYPYRLGIQSMCEGESNAHYAALLNRLKSALDPDGILAPGRYQELAATTPEIQNRSYAT